MAGMAGGAASGDEACHWIAANHSFIMNLRFKEWASIFGDARMTTVLLDCLTNRDQILEIGNDRFRFRASSDAAARKKTDTDQAVTPA